MRFLGGAAGALVAGLVMLPLLGNALTLGILGLVVATNGLVLTVRGRPAPAGRDWFERLARPVGYVLFGIAALFLIESHLWARGQAQREGNRLQTAAQEMLTSLNPPAAYTLTESSAQRQDGKAAIYYEANDDKGTAGGYVFATEDWAQRVYGYGGPINLAVFVDQAGVLRDYRIIRSNETPAYLNMLRDWKQRLMGKKLFEPDPFKGVDAVSGATLTSGAILRSVESAGRTFAAQALGRDVGAPEPARGVSWNPVENKAARDFLCLVVLTLAVLALRYRPQPWVRRLVLLTAFVVTGLWLNLQYSTQQVMSLLSLHVGRPGFSASFYLVAGIPVVVLLFGNVYCGYLCPIGAVQELVGDLWPKRNARDPSKRTWRYGRAVKYVLLFILAVVYALTRDYVVLEADPLVTIFGSGRSRAVLGMVAGCVGLSLFFRRFWCRNLCPAGAFLSLLNGARLLRRIVPARQPQRCDMGVQTVSDLDCLYCDRCLMPQREAVMPPTRAAANEPAFLVAVAIAAFAFAALTVSEVKSLSSATSVSMGAQGPVGSAGKPRNLDLDRVRQLIQQRGLSDHEAQFAKPVPEAGPLGEPPRAIPPSPR
jgi:Na+-translocating ferredoxin:NAD+ oxidoreductase RnfG subunit